MKSVSTILTSSLLISLVVSGGFMAFEPGVASAQATDGVIVGLLVGDGITITDGGNVTMAPNLSQTTDSSIGGTAWTVGTNNVTGYKLEVEATSTPALRDSVNNNEFADKSSSLATWAVTAGTIQFGFSAFGDDVLVGFGTSANCGAGGTPAGTLNYRGFAGTTKIEIATSDAPTDGAGTVSNICFAAGQNGVYAPSGSYQATITATATTI